MPAVDWRTDARYHVQVGTVMSWWQFLLFIAFVFIMAFGMVALIQWLTRS